jgi:hypothetical protein
VAVQGDGSLWAVFADATSGDGSYRFRFLYPGAPDEEGRTTVDFNRAVLPPCAFADAFICLFSPLGSTLAVAIGVGERNLVRSRSGAVGSGHGRSIPIDRSKVEAERCPCGDRSSGRILPPQRLSGPRRIRNPGAQRSWLRLTGPDPTRAPDFPGGNET